MKVVATELPGVLLLEPLPHAASSVAAPSAKRQRNFKLPPYNRVIVVSMRPARNAYSGLRSGCPVRLASSVAASSCRPKPSARRVRWLKMPTM